MGNFTLLESTSGSLASVRNGKNIKIKVRCRCGNERYVWNTSLHRTTKDGPVVCSRTCPLRVSVWHKGDRAGPFTLLEEPQTLLRARRNRPAEVSKGFRVLARCDAGHVVTLHRTDLSRSGLERRGNKCSVCRRIEEVLARAARGVEQLRKERLAANLPWPLDGATDQPLAAGPPSTDETPS